ncbi:hypothetical protein NIT60_04535 [Mammaliicoccus sciuri]|nr:hypothetical protein NIT60_04535 [Mammaliicoccus sciuri]
MVLSTLVVGYVKKYPFGKLMVVTFILSGVFLLLGFVTPIYIFIILFGLSWLSVGLANILFLSAGQAIIPEYILGRITSITSSLGVIGLPFRKSNRWVFTRINEPNCFNQYNRLLFYCFGDYLASASKT